MSETKARPACHRLYVPLAIPTPVLDPLTGKQQRSLSNPNQVAMEVKPQVVNAECLGAACMLWNPDRSECYDVTQARAIQRIADNYIVPQGAGN